MLHERTQPTKGTSIKLSSFFQIKRGLATGANDFFIVTQEQVEEFSLPKEFLIPILPSPRYLKQDIIEADESGDPILEEKLFLLSCDLPESQVKRLYPSLWNYYQIGIERKVHQTYICSHRSPWYSQESRPPCPLLCTYMGRHSPNKNNPFRFILNYSNACAANVYLLLYPKPIVDTFIRESPEAIRRLWQALRQISVKSLVGEGRVYGGGLHKLEPRELSNASAESILASLVKLSGNSLLHDPDLFLGR
jgi:hypothetical protein